MNLFPHIATVTYLSNIGGPTMVVARQGPFLYGSDVSGPVEACHLSLPQVAKHFCCTSPMHTHLLASLAIAQPTLPS